MSKRLLPLVSDALSVLQVQPAFDGLVIVITPRPAPVVCPACQMDGRAGFDLLRQRVVYTA